METAFLPRSWPMEDRKEIAVTFEDGHVEYFPNAAGAQGAGPFILLLNEQQLPITMLRNDTIRRVDFPANDVAVIVDDPNDPAKRLLVPRHLVN